MTQEDIRDTVIDTLKMIFDPEIPVNIYDMGLIYDVDVSGDAVVDIKMTLTSPTCPVAETLPPEVRNKVRELDCVKEATVDLVWEPMWDKNMMSEAARLQLGFF